MSTKNAFAYQFNCSNGYCTVHAVVLYLRLGVCMCVCVSLYMCACLREHVCVCVCLFAKPFVLYIHLLFYNNSFS